VTSLVGFTPISEDGMMVVVWTEGIHTKYRSKEHMEINQKRVFKNLMWHLTNIIFTFPGVFLLLCLLTPLMQVVLVLVRNNLCLYPQAIKLARPKTCPDENLNISPDEIFQNHCLHFSFLCSDVAQTKKLKNQHNSDQRE